MLPQTSKVLIRKPVASPLGGISLAGVARRGIGVPVPNRILNRHSLVYVFGGDGYYTDETVSNHPIEPGDLIQLLPNTRHGYGPRSGRNWHEVYIIFEGPVFDLWQQQKCLEIGGPIRSLRPIDYWRDRFLEAIGEGQDEGNLGSAAEVVRIQSLLVDIHNALQGHQHEESLWLREAKQSIAVTDSVKEAAEELCIGYESFRKRFRKLYGIPPAKYRATLEMQKACDLLTQTTLSVKAISAELAYCDEFHFSKRFSQIVGCSPRTYRSRTTEN
ncbi:MAG: helix-turn-helix domain-containing protein [Woeseiaceae bacterium]